jgi:hypothetical protein
MSTSPQKDQIRILVESMLAVHSITTTEEEDLIVRKKIRITCNSALVNHRCRKYRALSRSIPFSFNLNCMLKRVLS